VTEIDVDGRLATWMDAAGLGVGAPIEHRYVSGGSQNEIYEIRRGDRRSGCPVNRSASTNLTGAPAAL
jgi:hypothetical protein